MKSIRGLWMGGILLLVIACSGNGPRHRPSRTEQAKAINAVFETPKPYATRRMDSLDVLRFLAADPQRLRDSAELVEFYAGRDYQYAWFLNDTLSSAAGSMLNLLDPLDSDAEARPWRALIAEARSVQGGTAMADSIRLQVELGLTYQYFRMAEKEYGGYVQGDLRALDWYIPRRKKNYAMLLDSLVAGRTDLSPIEPVHPQYRLLKKELQRYYALKAAGPWDPITLDTDKVEFGDSLERLCALRHRLFLLGDLATDNSTCIMDSSLFKGVLNCQQRLGLKATGMVDPGLIAALDVPIADRIRTILLNMERLRWVNPSPPDSFLLVNIPEYRLHVIENGKDTWGMKVVVGTEATHTVIFSGELSMVAFAPYWNIPRSIVSNEIIPGMRRDPNYLAHHDMEVLRGGVVLSEDVIGQLPSLDAASISVRQRPGPNNSLGLVKFLFPNEYSIYLHDTPAKERFIPEMRAFSHGCIRLSEPVRLAEYLFQGDTTWTPEAIQEAMHAGKEQVVMLPHPIPVVIGYFTAWMDAQGRLNFRDDVYGHDARLARELFLEDTLVAK